MIRDAKYRFTLNGVEVNAPEDWESVQTLATFDNDSVQANVSTSEITFALDGNKLIREWVRGDLGIFQGLPMDISVINGTQTSLIGRYVLDFKSYEELESDKVKVSFRFLSGLNLLFDRIEGISFPWLESLGLFRDKEQRKILVCVDAEDKSTQYVLLALTSYVLISNIQQIRLQIKSIVTTVKGIAASGLGGSFGAALYSVIMLAAIAAFLVGLALALGRLLQQVFEFLSFVSYRRRIYSFKTYLEVVAEHLDLTLETDLPLEDYWYLPTPVFQSYREGSLIFRIGQTVGGAMPSAGDFGYNCSEMFEIVKRLFGAKYAIIGNRLIVRNEDDPYWIQQSSYVIPEDTLVESEQFNTQDLAGNKLYTFETDASDSYTVTRYKGTSYEIITRGVRTPIQLANLIHNYDRVSFEMARGIRLDSFSATQSFFNAITTPARELDKLLGGASGLGGFEFPRLGSLRIGDALYTAPKLLYRPNDILPRDHNANTTAKYFYEKYLTYNSFVEDNFRGQKRLYRGVRVPFNYENWLEVTNNSFATFKGRPAKIEQLNWHVQSDYATIDFWVRRPYTTNLAENKIEP